MNIKKFLSCVGVGSLALAFANPASAVTLINGSFELGTNPGTFTTVKAGQSNITGWTVGGIGGVDYIGSYWTAADGSRSIDLSGNSAGSISQTFATVVGQQYLVNFSLAGNPDDQQSSPIKTLITSDGGTYPQVDFFSTAGATRANMGWERMSYLFTAFGTSSTLTFASATKSAFGPALDNVSVTAVPEPASWAMMLAGFGMVGFAARRRAKPSVKVTYA